MTIVKDSGVASGDRSLHRTIGSTDPPPQGRDTADPASGLERAGRSQTRRGDGVGSSTALTNARVSAGAAARSMPKHSLLGLTLKPIFN